MLEPSLPQKYPGAGMAPWYSQEPRLRGRSPLSTSSTMQGWEGTRASVGVDTQFSLQQPVKML